MDCFILTYCPTPAELYGNLLALRSFRVGFPDPATRLHVADNGSCPAVLQTLYEATLAVGGEFSHVAEPISHADFVTSVLQRTRGELWIIDPDVVFWSRVSRRGAVIGRYLPSFHDPYSGCLTLPRLHTSLLGFEDGWWARNFEPLRAVYPEISLAPRMWVEEGQWRRADTAQILIETPHESFDPGELDRYDHLFCGTSFAEVAPWLPTPQATLFAELHDAVRRGEIEKLRGCWRVQEQFFSESRVR